MATYGAEGTAMQARVDTKVKPDMAPKTAPWRSLLFVGADQRDKIARAATRGADAIILDLEDAVAPASKAGARRSLDDAIQTLAQEGQPTVVRINTPWRDAIADLDVAVRPGVSALMVPGCVSAQRLVTLAEMLSELELHHGLDSPIGLIALVESAAGLTNLSAIAAAPRVIALAMGTEDLALDMHAAPTPALLDLPARQIALAARAHGLSSFAVPISIGAFADEDAYRSACLDARAYGVSGAICIHPTQIRIANAIFRPREAELDEAHAILAAWDDRGTKNVVSWNGKMIDLPVVQRARELLASVSH